MKFLKNILKNFGILLGLLVVLALINRWYLGGFTKLEVKEQPIGPYTIAYVNFVGEYGKVGPSMTKVYDVLSGAGITSLTGIGIYYDDPAVVSGANLRSDVGAVIAVQDLKTLVKNKDIQTKTLTAGKKMIVEFPMKNTLSVMIGVMKVYPVITKYMEAKGYKAVPMIELYDSAAQKIYYIADIAVK